MAQTREYQGFEARTEGSRRLALLATGQAESLADRWLSGYPNAGTQRDYRSRLKTLCAHAGIERPETATEAQLIGRVTAAQIEHTETL